MDLEKGLLEWSCTDYLSKSTDKNTKTTTPKNVNYIISDIFYN